MSLPPKLGIPLAQNRTQAHVLHAALSRTACFASSESWLQTRSNSFCVNGSFILLTRSLTVNLDGQQEINPEQTILSWPHDSSTLGVRVP